MNTNVEYPIRQIGQDEFPWSLAEIPDAPDTLYIRGSLPPTSSLPLAVVGSRRLSAYGKRVCEDLIAGLRGYPVVIVSGLALGIDSVAHESALRNNLPTIAVMPSGLSDTAIYPATHRPLAQKILQAGGCLLSEYEPDARPAPWTFPGRNRLMAGMCIATLVIEAAERSGTMITTRLALEYNREVLAVPHQLGSETGAGTNTLLRRGATLVRHSADVLEALGIEASSPESITPEDLTPDEILLYAVLNEPVERGDIGERAGLPAQRVNIALSGLVIKGVVREEMGRIVRT